MKYQIQVKELDILKDIVFDIRATYQCRICQHYGKCHTCPPNIPDTEYWKRLCRSYNKAELHVLTAEYTNETFDVVRVNSAKQLHLKLLERERECFVENKYWAAALVGGSCRICPNGCGPICKYPEKSRVALEGAGIDVITTCKNVGITLPKYPHPNSTGKLARVGMLLVE